MRSPRPENRLALTAGSWDPGGASTCPAKTRVLPVPSFLAPGWLCRFLRASALSYLRKVLAGRAIPPTPTPSLLLGQLLTQSHLPGCGAWAGMRGPMLRRPHTGFNALLVLVVFRQRSSFSHLALGSENHVASTGDNQHVRALKTFLQKASFLMERKAEIRKCHNCFQFLL